MSIKRPPRHLETPEQAEERYKKLMAPINDPNDDPTGSSIRSKE